MNYSDPIQLPRHKQLAHDIANDLNALVLTLLALPDIQADQDQFATTIQMMRDHIRSLETATDELVAIVEAAT